MLALSKNGIRKLEHENKILKSEKVEFDMRTLVLQEDLEKLKGTLSMKDEAFATDFTELKQKVESLLVENNKLLEKLKQVESDFTANRSCNSSSQALNWLNTHHSQK